MEDKNDESDKTQRLKINHNSTIENVRERLEQCLQAKEIDILVSLNKDLSHYFTLINQSLSTSQFLKELIIEFEYFRSFKFEDSIFYLNRLHQITNLSLFFQENPILSLSQNIQLRQCLQQFQSLSSLTINLSCTHLKNQENFFRLLDYYQEAPLLSSIDYSVNYVPERSTIFYSLLEGLRYLMNLKSITFNIVMSKVKSYVIIDLLEDELKDNTQIKELNLDFGYQTFITNHDFKKIEKLLRSQNHLEKLSISSYSSIKKEIIETIQLEDDISALKQLKELTLNFSSDLYMKFGNLFEEISTMKHLENVELHLSFQNEEILNNDILQFGKTLSKIENLTVLNLTFDYEYTLSVEDIILFVIELWPLNKIKTLIIDLCSMNGKHSNGEMREIDFDKFNEVISRLAHFEFKKNTEWHFLQDDNINKIFESIQSANKLKELELQFNNYYEKDDTKKQTLQFVDFLENKTSLEYINLYFDHHFSLNKKQLFSIFQRFQYNSKLQQIQLTFNNKVTINDEDLKELSDGLKQLNELFLLYLTFNLSIVFSDASIIYFADSLSQQTSLKNLMLDISKDTLSSKTLNHLITMICQIKKLRNLNLKITGQSFVSDMEELNFGNCFTFQPKMTYLDISLQIPGLKYKNLENMFKSVSQLKKIAQVKLCFQFEATQEDCIQITEYFQNLKLLKVLSFNSFTFQMLYLINLFNKLPLLSSIIFNNEYKDMTSIVRAYKKLKKQKGESDVSEKVKLKIQNKMFFVNKTYEKENASTIVPFILQNLIQLKKLKLYFCKNNEIGLDYSCLMYKNLRILENLEHLEIHIQENNQIGSECLITLGETLSELPQLKRLIIVIDDNKNNIKWKNCSQFFTNLGKLINLELLQITLVFQKYEDYENKECEEACLSLLKNISNLINLKTLELLLSSKTITESIVDYFSNLSISLKSSLKTLSIYLDEISTENIRQIKQSIRSLDNLQYLKINTEVNNLQKVKRLVNITKLSYYYPKYDYY